MIDPDKINNADGASVAQASLDVLNYIQDLRPELQVLGLASAFSVFCRKQGADPAEVFRAATNVLASKHRDAPPFVALDLYVRHEL